MKVIYKAYDGKEFTDEKACMQHERALHNHVIMINRRGERIFDDTNCATVLWLDGPYAADIFLRMAEDCGDETAKEWISSGDTGCFIWEEGLEQYLAIDNELVDTLAALHAYLSTRSEQ